MTGKDGASELGAVLDQDFLEEDVMEFTIDELREFLEADHLAVQADPGFKERLRRRLWDLLQGRSVRVGRKDPGAP